MRAVAVVRQPDDDKDTETMLAVIIRGIIPRRQGCLRSGKERAQKGPEVSLMTKSNENGICEGSESLSVGEMTQ